MKTEPKQSAIKEWVFDLPFTQQALLMLALRGPDGLPKNTAAKNVVHFIRGVVLNAAYDNYTGEPEGFMRADYDNFMPCVHEMFNDMDAYPMHFLMHLIHAGEVIGYNHPDPTISGLWSHFYNVACHNFHMQPETKEKLNKRLSK